MVVVNASWLNENANRNYPLEESATRLSNEAWTLPNNLLVDLSLSAVATLQDPTQFFLSKTTFAGSILDLEFSYYDQGTPVVVASARVDFTSHRDYASYEIVGADDYPVISGRVSIGPYSVIHLIDPGENNFTFDAGRLAVSTIRPSLGAITAIIANNQRLVGDVELVAGDGVSIDVDAVNNTITINVDANSLDLTGCGCAGDVSPVLTINGVAPDGNGNISIRGEDCLTLIPGDASLTWSDRCSAPCCDCLGLVSLTEALQSVTPRIEEITQFVESVRNRLELALSFLEGQL